MTEYAITKILMRVHLNAYQQLHRLTDIEYNRDRFRRLERYLRKEKVVNNTRHTDQALARMRPALMAGITSCRSRNVTDRQLKNLMKISWDMGGSGLVWCIRIDHDTRGRIEVNRV